MSNAPVVTPDFPHMQQFGASLILRQPEGDFAEQEFYCEFRHTEGVWLAIFMAGVDSPVTDLFGAGDTPRAAFEQLISRHTILNGGVTSELLRRILPTLRRYFTPEGSLSPGHIPEGVPLDIEQELSDLAVPPATASDIATPLGGHRG